MYLRVSPVCYSVLPTVKTSFFFYVVKLGVVLNLLAVLQKSYAVVNVIMQCGR